MNDEQDDVCLKMFNEKKGTQERKKLEDKLADVKKFIDACQNAHETLLQQQDAARQEREQITRRLDDKKREKDKMNRKLQTVKSVSSQVASASGASDTYAKFLKEKSDEFSEHFTAHPLPEDDFVAAMQAHERNEKFLQGIEASIRDLSTGVVSEQMANRSQLARSMLQDLVGLQRSWTELLRDRWAKDDFDLSCFFYQDAVEKKATQKKPGQDRLALENVILRPS